MVNVPGSPGYDAGRRTEKAKVARAGSWLLVFRDTCQVAATKKREKPRHLRCRGSGTWSGPILARRGFSIGTVTISFHVSSISNDKLPQPKQRDECHVADPDRFVAAMTQREFDALMRKRWRLK